MNLLVERVMSQLERHTRADGPNPIVLWVNIAQLIKNESPSRHIVNVDNNRYNS